MEDIYKTIDQRPEPLWTVERVAEYLSLNSMTVYRWAKIGKIKSMKISNRVRIPESEVKRIAGETRTKLTP